jgi:hypothetical protein
LQVGTDELAGGLRRGLDGLVLLRNELASRKGSTMVLETSLRVALDGHMAFLQGRAEILPGLDVVLAVQDERLRDCITCAIELWPLTTALTDYLSWFDAESSKVLASASVDNLGRILDETTPTLYAENNDARADLDRAIQSCALATLGQPLVEKALAFQRGLVGIIQDSFPQAEDLPNGILLISDTLGEKGDAELTSLVHECFLPAYELAKHMRQFEWRGSTLQERISADTDRIDVVVMMRVTTCLKDGLAKRSATVVSQKIADHNEDVQRLIRDVTEWSCSEAQAPLVAKMCACEVVVEEFGTWRNGFNKDTDWETCHAKAVATILLKDPTFFRIHGDELQTVVDHSISVHSSFDVAEPPLAKTANELLKSLRLLYVEGLFCSIFKPPLDEEGADQRKKQVHKIEKLVRNMKGLVWKDLSAPLLERAILAKQLE